MKKQLTMHDWSEMDWIETNASVKERYGLLTRRR